MAAVVRLRRAPEQLRRGAADLRRDAEGLDDAGLDLSVAVDQVAATSGQGPLAGAAAELAAQLAAALQAWPKNSRAHRNPWVLSMRRTTNPRASSATCCGGATQLLATLESPPHPTRGVRERVLEVVADEFDEHVSSVDSQPTAWGKRVDDELGRFLPRFAIES